MSKITTTPAGKAPADRSVQHISAEGDIKLRYLTLSIVGALLIIIAIGGFFGLILNEPAFGKHWQGFQAILSGAIFGLIGFIAGRSGRSSGDS
ncbi:hypothetical protein QYM18_06310 [Ectopseudomonas chengduensis]|nr:hypothetical protein [Pseudomonas chengduensis]WKC38697.1 hypothetical protein QYM18_06310 [Pseudomonas chengduensis]